MDEEPREGTGGFYSGCRRMLPKRWQQEAWRHADTAASWHGGGDSLGDDTVVEDVTDEGNAAAVRGRRGTAGKRELDSLLPVPGCALDPSSRWHRAEMA